MSETFHLVRLPSGVFRGELFRLEIFFTKTFHLVGLSVGLRLTQIVLTELSPKKDFPNFSRFFVDGRVCVCMLSLVLLSLCGILLALATLIRFRTARKCTAASISDLVVQTTLTQE